MDGRTFSFNTTLRPDYLSDEYQMSGKEISEKSTPSGPSPSDFGRLSQIPSRVTSNPSIRKSDNSTPLSFLE